MPSTGCALPRRGDFKSAQHPNTLVIKPLRMTFRFCRGEGKRRHRHFCTVSSGGEKMRHKRLLSNFTYLILYHTSSENQLYLPSDRSKPIGWTHPQTTIIPDRLSVYCQLGSEAFPLGLSTHSTLCWRVKLQQNRWLASKVRALANSVEDQFGISSAHPIRCVKEDLEGCQNRRIILTSAATHGFIMPCVKPTIPLSNPSRPGFSWGGSKKFPGH
jgi:hypothetical protein